MSRLSPALKAAINSSFARPNTVPAPKRIRDIYRQIEEEATARKVGLMAWMTISAAATTTLNSPESLLILHSHCTSRFPSASPSSIHITEQIREIVLKCLPFNGIPRTINVLTSFRASLPAALQSQLSTRSRRLTNAATVTNTHKRGRALWDSIYAPLDKKLISKLGDAHPDLPHVILDGGYSVVLADPPATGDGGKGGDGALDNDTSHFEIGRVLTSLVAIACLRAQTGVAPQVVSHVFGLRKAYESGDAEAAGEVEVEGGDWLASEEGNLWILEVVDRIVSAIGGSNFAAGGGRIEAKL